MLIVTGFLVPLPVTRSESVFSKILLILNNLKKDIRSFAIININSVDNGNRMPFQVALEIVDRHIDRTDPGFSCEPCNVSGDNGVWCS